MTKRKRRGSLCAAAAALVCAALAAPGGAAAAAMPGCAASDSPGGDWPSFGHDLSNTRVQQNEKVLSVADAPALHPVWAFSTSRAGGAGDITGTPIESNGCVYVATNQGWVFSMNADTGKLVWKAQLPRGGTSNSTVLVAERQCGTTSKRVRVRVKVRTKRRARHRRRAHGASASAARARKHRKKKKAKYRWVWVTKKTPVRCGTVYVASTRTRDADECPAGEKCKGPYVVAFDQASGRVAWYTPPIDTQPGADMYASPVVFDGTLFVGVSGGAAELGDEANRYAFQGSYVLLDADNGRMLKKKWVIHPPGQPDDDFAGGTIWSTPAVDPADKVAFIGTSNPFRPQAESPLTNAVLKIDLNRKSPRFGEILGSYKGLVDTYYPQASEFPCYDVPGNPPPYYPQGLGSCMDLDLDFGAPPHIFTENGRKLVADGQKSGVFHIFDAHTMQQVRTQVVGPPSAVGGIVGATAFDGSSFYGPITAPGYLWSLNSSDLKLRWIGPVGDGAHYGPPVAVANGVVYTVDLTGFLDAYDARSGVQIAKHPLILGGSSPPTLSWGGVSVARNSIYTAVGTQNLTDGYVVAFKAGGVQSVPGDVQNTVQSLLGTGGGGGGGGGGSGNGSTVVAGPGATYTTYATPVVSIQKGQTLNFVNLDAPQHDVTADQKGGDGRPIFQSKLSGLGQVVPVDGADRAEPGSYGFFCSIHPGMRGTLVVR